MRLDDYDPNSVDVQDQGRRGGGMRMPGGRGGQVGCGTIVITLIAALVFGVDPAQMLGGAEMQQGSSGQEQAQTGSGSEAEACAASELKREGCNVLSSLNKTWQPIFREAGVEFRQPKLRYYTQQGESGCGSAQSAMGPFYCPGDEGIYIDTDFYTEMEQRLGAQGDFARAYVMAHEYGHHIQKLTGIADQIRSVQQQRPNQANQLQVRMELQADCYAGVWAAKNRDRIEAGDMEEGLGAAHSIGDDTLMRNAGRRPVESSFTHGTSAQRMEWLRKGMQSGNDATCDQLMR